MGRLADLLRPKREKEKEIEKIEPPVITSHLDDAVADVRAFWQCVRLGATPEQQQQEQGEGEGAGGAELLQPLQNPALSQLKDSASPSMDSIAVPAANRRLSLFTDRRRTLIAAEIQMNLPVAKKAVRWKEFNRVKLGDEVFHLPSRFIAADLIKVGPSGSVCCASDVDARRHLAVRKVDVSNSRQLRSILRHIRASRHAPHNTICPVVEWFIREGAVYTCTELLDGGLADLADEAVPHAVVARLAYQLIDAVAHIHSIGGSHGNLSAAAIVVNTDATLRLVDYGRDDGAEMGEEAQQDDIRSIALLVARFLLDSPTFERIESLPFDQIPFAAPDQDEKHGLTDKNARSLVTALFSDDCSLCGLLSHPYLASQRGKRESARERCDEVFDTSAIPDEDVLDMIRAETELMSETPDE